MQRGSDMRYDLDITFEEAVYGCEKEVDIELTEKCEHCGGLGGFDEIKCSTCGGSGVVRQQQNTLFGSFMSQTTCPTCGGKGRTFKRECSHCHGKGYNRCSYCKGTGLMKCTVCNGKKKSTCYICKGDKISIHTVAMEQEYIPLTIRSMHNEKIVDRKIYKKKNFSPYAPSGYDYYVNETMLSESQVLSNPAFKKQYKDFKKSIKNRKLEGVGQFVAYSLKECRHSYYDINYLVNKREYNALVEMSSRTVIMDKNPVVDFMNDNLGLLDEYLEQHNYKGYVTKHNQCIKIARTNGGKLKKPSSEAYRKVQKMISNLALIPAFILVAFLFYKFPAEFKQMWVLLSATLSVVLTSTFLGKVWESFLGVVGDGKLVVAIIFWSLFIELFAFGCLFLILGYLMTGALPI